MRFCKKDISKIHFFLLAVIISLPSCIERHQYPIEPVIELKNFYIITDTIPETDTGVIVIGFTDGDGDIGLDAEDTLYPYNSGGNYYYNFLMNIYKKQGNDTLRIPYNLRIPPINPDDYDQNLKGDIFIEITIIRSLFPDNKFQFEAFIYDRKLHKSNVIVSPVYLI